MRFYSENEGRTEEIGAKLAKTLTHGAFVAVRGDLGAGKTAFVRGFAGALGAQDVSSPTYTIVHEYDSIPSVFHFDVYRLKSAQDLNDISFEDYLNRNGIIIMEWPQIIEEALPKNRIEVNIRRISDEEREIDIMALGATARGAAALVADTLGDAEQMMKESGL